MKVEYKGHYGDDLFVVNVARQSTNRWKETFEEEDAKLIRYLAREKHISPFFHPKITIQIEVPFAIARQWERHRIGVSRLDDFSDMNEVSRRYVSADVWFFEPEMWRSRPEKSIKQGSGDPLNQAEQSEADYIYNQGLTAAYNAYQGLLSLGVAPEQARFVLPTATNTRWIETG